MKTKTTRREALEKIEGIIHGESVIYWDHGTHRWYVGDESDLDRLAVLMDEEAAEIERDGIANGGAYSLWCSETSHSEHSTEDDAKATAARTAR